MAMKTATYDITYTRRVTVKIPESDGAYDEAEEYFESLEGDYDAEHWYGGDMVGDCCVTSVDRDD